MDESTFFFFLKCTPVNKNRETGEKRKKERKTLLRPLLWNGGSIVLRSLEKLIDCLSRVAYLQNKKPELASTVFSHPFVMSCPPRALH